MEPATTSTASAAAAGVDCKSLQPGRGHVQGSGQHSLSKDGVGSTLDERDGAEGGEDDEDGGDEEGGDEEGEDGNDQPAELVSVPTTFKLGATVKRRPSKRFSVVACEGNPLAASQAGAKMASGKSISLKVENTSDARPITDAELKEQIRRVAAFE
jgi:hypothetical protein